MDENAERDGHGLQQIDGLASSANRARAVSPDRLVSVVANGHRRAILNSLTSASDQTLEYDALVDRVADRVRDEDTERAADEQHQRVRIALTHTHLPKLEEVRLIDYETETGLVQFVGGELEQELLTLLASYGVDE
ncbi:hypothetical protein Halru_2654 [Halovivax ruber XH-70]|uniref:DUF7344 domain-containing protein n=1 Tax=Halovivax ruber (strain DSM 18193 / JCM 13892 / XH-70) TaxID=797302 RepID=L0IG80_HALRX|nr:hypothetical protein [Halovivax ruber]AGB17231.1 hypothetical protein Halru_2654 [Halovivax ruber XH-70]